MLVGLEPSAVDNGCKLTLESIYALLLPVKAMQVLTKQILYAVATRLEVILGAEKGRVKLDPAENILFAWAGPVTESQEQSYCCAS